MPVPKLVSCWAHPQEYRRCPLGDRGVPAAGTVPHTAQMLRSSAEQSMRDSDRTRPHRDRTRVRLHHWKCSTPWGTVTAAGPHTLMPKRRTGGTDRHVNRAHRTGQSRARGTTYGKCLQSRAKKGLVTLGPQGKLKTAPPLYTTRKLTSGRSQIPTGKAERSSVQMKTQKDVR